MTTAPVADVRVAMELEVPTDVRLIEPVVALLSRHARELDFPAQMCRLNVPVALSEALSNAMLRGNRDDRAKHVRIRAAFDRHGLVLEVADEGGGFDLELCSVDPTTPENVAREDGRGLFLMHRLMDRVERFTDAGVAGGLPRGNVVRLTLKRP